MKRKALYIVMIIAIILGAIILKTKGFNYSTLYGEHERLEISLGKDYKIKDIKKILNQTVNGNPVVRTTTLFKTSIAIDSKKFSDDDINKLFTKLNEKYTTDFNIKDIKKDSILDELNVESLADMTDEQKTALIAEIKEKYNLEYTIEELEKTTSKVQLSTIAKISLFDTLKPFIVPFAISLAILMIYFATKYHKAYKNAWILAPIKLAFEMIITQGFILSVIVIARIPVSSYIPTLVIIIWILQAMSETLKNEKTLAESKAEKN